jgi:hypothetical protein
MARRRHSVVVVLVLVVAVTGCGGPNPPGTSEPRVPGPDPATKDGPAATPVPGPIEPPSPAVQGTGDACGVLDCRRFDRPFDAFAFVLERKPRVVAIGEAHALEGTAGVPSATARFTSELLPMLEGKASSLVVELLLPDPNCERDATEVRREQKVVTEEQAGTNQNEFVELGHRARALGIEPFPLRPTCERLAKIASAGPDTVIEMLLAITELTTELVRRLVARDAASGGDSMVVAYGGAMHNDLRPRPERASFSFGPSLNEHVRGRYVELDLIVPEYIKDTESWRSLPWYAAYDSERHGAHTVLFSTGPQSFVLVFPRTKPR